MKWGAGIAGVIWIFVVGFDQFFGGSTFDYANTVREEQLQRTLASCRGTFKERYNCKSSILLAEGRNSLNYWSKKYAISFARPIFLCVAFHMWLGRVETVEEKLRRKRLAIRMEKRRQKDSRIAMEQGRQRSLAANPSSRRIIAASPDFSALAAKEHIATATELAVDAHLEKPLNSPSSSISPTN